MRPAALVQLRPIGLHPTAYATGVDLYAAFRKQFGNVLVRQRVSQIPPDRYQDHRSRKMTPFERIVRGDRHGLLTLPEPLFRNFATEPWLIEEIMNCENAKQVFGLAA